MVDRAAERVRAAARRTTASCTSRATKASNRVVIEVRDLDGNVHQDHPAREGAGHHVRRRALRSTTMAIIPYRPGVGPRHRDDRLPADGDRAEQGHRRPARQIAVTQHKTTSATIKTKLDAVKTAAAALSDAATVEGDADDRRRRTRPSSTSTLLGGAGIGGHSIQINKLASSAQHGFTFTPSTPPPARSRSTTGPTRTLPTPSKVTIDVAANATADRRRHARSTPTRASPVYAAVIKDGGHERLVLSARKTGENSDFTVDTSALGAGSSLAEDPDRTRARARRLNASYIARRRGRPAHVASPTSSRTRSRACG